MSRFDLYGHSKCSECIYHKLSERCPKWRCTHEDNLKTNWLGTVYMKSPDHINWNYKCKWFKSNKNRKD